MPVWKRISSLLIAGCATASLFAQAPPAPPAPSPARPVPLGANGKPMVFDIISFRRTETHGPSRVDLPENGDSIAYHGQPIERIVYFAYLSVGPKIDGLPDWASTDLYDFQAKVAEEDIPLWQKMDLQSRRLMVRKVLEDAVKLKVRPNDKSESVYDLIVLPGGPKLTEHVDGKDKTFPDGHIVVGTDTHWTSPVEAYFQANTMGNLAESLSAHHTVDHNVIDKTGLTGKYDFTLPVPYSPPSPEMLEQFGLPSISSALQKLGLKLVPSKAIYPGLIIEHIERPPEN